jgi:hypothetical protein
MEPSDKLVRNGRCLAKPGELYLVYLPEGGQATLEIEAAAGPLPVERIDPRTGERTPLDPAQPGERLRLSAPSRQDWAFLVGKQKLPPKSETNKAP